MIFMFKKLLFVFSLLIFSSFILIKSADASTNSLTALYPGWYEANSSVTNGALSIYFDEYQPLGRISLIIYDRTEIQALDQAVTSVYEWQFIDALIDNPLNASIQLINQNNKSVSVWLNIDGTWKQVVSKFNTANNTVNFVIQSSRGQVVVTTGNPEIYFELPLTGDVLVQGYTIETPAKDLRVGIMPNLVDIDFVAKIRSLPTHYSRSYLPKNLHFASEIYHVWLDSGEGSLPFSRSLPIEIAFPTSNDEYKAIYYFDSETNTWNLSPSTTRYTGEDAAEGYVRTLTFQKEMIITVVTNPQLKEWGRGSWFSSDLISRNRAGSANNDFPLGTMVRVTNLDNDKFVDTEIISRGPYADFRIIDLGSDSFKKIASLGAGVINVKVEPLYKLPK